MDLASNEQKIEPPDELQQLREENARLKGLLNSYGITLEEIKLLLRSLHQQNCS